MAQQTNIAIPARFSFRPFRAHWMPGWAEIVDWYSEPETPLGIFAKSLLGNPSKSKASGESAISPASEKVVVSLNVTSAQTELSGTYGMLAGLFDSDEYTVEMYRSDIPVEVLRPHENRLNAPDIGGRVFDVLTCHLPAFREFLSSPEPESVTKDAWEMREDFLGIERETWALSLFLSRWGLWSQGLGYATRVMSNNSPLGFALTFPHLIWAERERYSKAMAGKPIAWLKTAPPLNFRQTSEPPYFDMESSYCKAAIEATISIDHLRNLKYRLCKLKDCQKPYRVRTKQQRMYCSTKCAHLANVRKLRAEKKKAESKGRKHATRKS
jgi:hypothetical protein